ncbi:transcription repressor OFP7-like [Mangifera indica]|uniref:transcription repressor OFP7-like n=1 Tax=Mangifera indica TaxID=29780 RepID=UPI001CFA3926|nr:transcription repressor OFP7-like [Mangifera indica]
MAKGFKLRMSRFIATFSSCRSKDPSTLPSNPVPSVLRFSLASPPKHTAKTLHTSFKRHVSSAITCIACGCTSRSTSKNLALTDHCKSPLGPEFHWEKEDNFHVVAKVFDETPRQKIYNSSASASSRTSCDDEVLMPPPPPPNTEKKKRRVRRKKRTPPKTRISTSSAETELFSSEDYDDVEYVHNEETETLVSSSRSLSTDYSSSEFYPKLETIREIPLSRSTRKKNRIKKVKRSAALKKSQVITKRIDFSSPEVESPARLSMFLQRLIPCTVDGKVRESFAVVKKSEDPYEDFKGSMLEMILEKQMFEEHELEELLHCFLSLNSRQHHRVIVEAFTEIWEAMFYRSSGSFRISRGL